MSAGITLDSIARSYLQQVKKPIHCYYRVLKYGADCLRELLFDTLRITNTIKIAIDENGEGALPVDYIDVIKVGTGSGQYIKPLVRKNSLNRMANYNESGVQIPYTNTDTLTTSSDANDWFGWSYSTHINQYGENTGGYYGLGAGSESDTYEIIEERNVIKVNENISVDYVYMQYLGSGMFINAATRINPYAQKTIEAYMDWQYKLTSKSFGAYDHKSAEIQFGNQLRVLRGRLNELTPEIVERVINRNRKATVK